uniref:Uncharacterized protein n=1 Tax=Lutzomyia longipalpis TaxID=7200 RepID=A0A1B0GHI6_LUTLO
MTFLAPRPGSTHFPHFLAIPSRFFLFAVCTRKPRRESTERVTAMQKIQQSIIVRELSASAHEAGQTRQIDHAEFKFLSWMNLSKM